MAIRSRPFEPNRETTNPRFDAFVQQTLARIEHCERTDGTRRKARSPTDQRRDTQLLRALLLDFWCARQSSTRLCIGISRDNSWYGRNKAALPDFMTSTRVRNLVDYLADRRIGYLWRVKPGYCTPDGIGANTKYRARPRLAHAIAAATALEITQVSTSIERFVIRLKDADKRYLPVPRTTQVRTRARTTARINRVLQRHWLDLALDGQQLAALQQRLQHRHTHGAAIGETLDLSKRTLYRVYSNGDFTQGGRFYGGWWLSVPRDVRPYLTIDGQRTVELDFKQMHPAILYAEKGLPAPADAYDVGLSSVQRDHVKTAFNALINAKDGFIRPPDDFDAAASGVSWPKLLRRIVRVHAPIADRFRTGDGLRLQGIDAQIAERVLLQFAQQDIPCYPLHDSFVIAQQHADALKTAMQDSFRAVVGAAIEVRLSTLPGPICVALTQQLTMLRRTLSTPSTTTTTLLAASRLSPGYTARAWAWHRQITAQAA